MTYTDAMRLQVQVMTEVLQKQHFSNFTAELTLGPCQTLQVYQHIPCIRLGIAVFPEGSEAADKVGVSRVASGLQHLVGWEMKFKSGPCLLGPHGFVVQVVHRKRQICELEQQCESKCHMIATENNTRSPRHMLWHSNVSHTHHQQPIGTHHLHTAMLIL